MKPWFPLQGHLPYTKISGSTNEGYNPSAWLQFSLPSKYICFHQNLHSAHFHMWLFMLNKMHVKWPFYDTGWWPCCPNHGKSELLVNSTLKEQFYCQTCLILHAWTFENAKATRCEEVTCCLCSTLCCTYTVNRKLCKMYVKGLFLKTGLF